MSERLFALIDDYIGALPELRQEAEKEIWRAFGVEGVVFVLDMSGFTSTVRKDGLLAFLARVRRMQKVVGAIIERHLGQVVKAEADNLYALFERPDNAIRAALELTYETPVEISSSIGGVGIGLSQGRLLFVPREDFFGHPVNVASTLAEDEAEAGEVLVDESLVGETWHTFGVEAVPFECTKSGQCIRAFRLRRLAS